MGMVKKLKLLFLLKIKSADDAKKEGAEIVGGQDLVDKIEAGFIDFDRVIAHQI